MSPEQLALEIVDAHEKYTTNPKPMNNTFYASWAGRNLHNIDLKTIALISGKQWQTAKKIIYSDRFEFRK